MEAVRAYHMVAQVHSDICVARVMPWRWMHRGGRHRYPCFRVVTIAVEPLGQLGLWKPGKEIQSKIKIELFGVVG